MAVQFSLLKYKFKVGSGVSSSPAFALSHVFFVTKTGFLICIDNRRGRFVWKFKTKCNSLNCLSPSSSPVIILLVKQTGKNDAAINSNNITTAVGDENDDADDDNNDKHDDNEGGMLQQQTRPIVCIGGVYCLDAYSGSLIFYTPLDNTLTSSPVGMSNDTLLVIGSTNATVYCMETSTGLPFWTATLSGGAVTGAVVSDRFGLVLLGTAVSYNRGQRQGQGSAPFIYALNGTDGSVVWKYSPAQGQGVSFLVQPTLDTNCSSSSSGETIFFPGHTPDGFGVLYSLDALTGKVNWAFILNTRIISRVVMSGEFVFLGAGDGILYVLDKATGRQAWQSQLDSAISASAGR